MRCFPQQRVLSAFCIVFVLQILAFQFSKAQSRRPSTNLGPVTLGGTVGIRTDTYRANGINDRRPNGSGQIFAKTTATWNSARYSLDFLFSTDDERIKQSQNRFAFSAAYKNWAGTLGFFSPAFNKFGLNGATIRGGHVRYTRDNIHLAFLLGQSQRAVDTGIGAVIRRPTFQRNMFSARAGIGSENKNYVHLSGLLARDKASSLTNSTFVTPAENALITPAFGLKLLENRLSINGEVTASAFSGDTRSARNASSDTPSFFGLFTPRVGSRFDFASAFTVRYTHLDFSESVSPYLDQFNLLTSYERINPGFVSLGRPYTRSDQAVFRFNPKFRLLDKKVQFGIDFTSRRNNLDNVRNATLKRNQIRFNTQAQLSPSLFLNAAYLRMSNKNESLLDDPALEFLNQRFVTNSFMIAPVLSTQLNGLSHRFSMTLSFQSLTDKTSSSSDLPSSSIGFNNSSSSLSHAVILASGLALNTSVSLINSSSTYSDVKAFGFQSGINYSFFERKLSAGLLSGFSRTTLDLKSISTLEEDLNRTEKSTQWTFTLNSTYRVTSRDIIRLMVRGFQTNQPLRGNFSELQSTLRIEHRF